MMFLGTLVALVFWIAFWTVLIIKLHEQYPPIDKTTRQDFESLRRHRETLKRLQPQKGKR